MYTVPFLSFAEHQQDLEDAVNIILEARTRGEKIGRAHV